MTIESPEMVQPKDLSFDKHKVQLGQFKGSPMIAFGDQPYHPENSRSEQPLNFGKVKAQKICAAINAAGVETVLTALYYASEMAPTDDVIQHLAKK
jgi:hypothetical protein